MKRTKVVRRSRLKRSTKPIKRRGKRRFPSREDREFLRWLRVMPCQPCLVSGRDQTSRTEVEHWVTKARGGYDRGDTWPTCGLHRTERHTLGDKTFQDRYPERDWSKEGQDWKAFYEGRPGPDWA